MRRRCSLKKSLLFFIVIISLVFIGIWIVNAGVLEYKEYEPDANTKLVKKYPSMKFVVLGVDKDKERSDVLIYAYFNSEKKILNLLQIPRDTKIETKRKDKKINSAYGSGKAELVMYELSKLLETDIKNYIVIDFEGFRKIIDLMGGVEMNVPLNMDYTDIGQDLIISLKKGMQILDGKKAEMLIRYRQGNNGEGYSDGDIGRLKIQKEFIENAARQFMQNTSSKAKVSAVITALPYVQTNYSAVDIVAASNIITDLDINNINIFLLPGTSKYEKKVSYYIPDINKTRQIITNFN